MTNGHLRSRRALEAITLALLFFTAAVGALALRAPTPFLIGLSSLYILSLFYLSKHHPRFLVLVSTLLALSIPFWPKTQEIWPKIQRSLGTRKIVVPEHNSTPTTTVSPPSLTPKSKADQLIDKIRTPSKEVCTSVSRDIVALQNGHQESPDSIKRLIDTYNANCKAYYGSAGLP